MDLVNTVCFGIAAFIGTGLGHWAFVRKIEKDRSEHERQRFLDKLIGTFTTMIYEFREVPSEYRHTDIDARLLLLRLLADNDYLNKVDFPFIGNDQYVHRHRLVFISAFHIVQTQEFTQYRLQDLTVSLAYKLQKLLNLKKYTIKEVTGTHDWLLLAPSNSTK